MAAQMSNYCQRKPNFTFIWTIENISALLHMETLQSPKFAAQSLKNTAWSLKMERSVLDILVMELRREDTDGCIEIELEISVIAEDGSPLRMERKTARLRSGDYCWLSLYPKTDDITFRKRPEFPLKDTLTIRCQIWQTGEELSKSYTCFARTRMGVDHRSFTWAIKEFSSLQPKQERTYILNPTIKGYQQLILKLYLKNEWNGKSFVNIVIGRNSEANNHGIFCKVSLLDSNGRIEYTKESYTTPYYVLQQPRVIYFLEFFEKDKLVNEQFSFLQDDILYLRCEFQIGVDPVWSRIEKYAYLNLEEVEQKIPETSEIQVDSFVSGCPFKRAFEDWYRDKRLCDVSLRTGEILLRAHKNVLSARSAVFKDMFMQCSRKKKRKLFDIPDFNADILERLLLYIYKDTVEELQWESAMDLYKAAIKYELLGLKEKCVMFLKSAFSVTNVCSIISFADMHEDSDVIKAALNFILTHDNEVFTSEEWVNFKETKAQLALIIMERINSLSKPKHC